MIWEHLTTAGIVAKHLNVAFETSEETGLEEDPAAFGAAFFTQIIEAADAIKPDMLLLDCAWWEEQFADLSLLECLVEMGVSIIGIDGPSSLNEAFDLVFFPSLAISLMNQESKDRVRFGPDCMLLPNRTQFEPRKKKDIVLVMNGGSDREGLGRVWPDFLAREIPQYLQIKWIQGPLAQRPIVRKSTMARVQFIVNPRNLKSHILSASFGLSVHGISAYELMASGIPTVVYSPYGEKDHDAMTKLEELGVAEIAQSPEEAVILLKNLISNRERSAQLSARAADTFHAKGEYTLQSEIRRILDGRA